MTWSKGGIQTSHGQVNLNISVVGFQQNNQMTTAVKPTLVEA